MNITKKINEIAVEYFDDNNSLFASKMGTSEANIRNYRTKIVPKLDFVVNLCNMLEISFDWFLNDVGSQKKVDTAYEANVDFTKPGDKKHPVQRVPLYDLEAAAGLVNIFQSNKQNIIDFITIPNLPKCDGAISITGDSMYPLLKSGDIVLYKILKDILNGIFFGEMYLISLNVDDEEMITVKFVQQSDLGIDYIKLVSENRHHSPKDVPVKMIRAMALVKASIRINSMN